MGRFASLTDVKAHLDKVSSVSDDELGLMLDAAEERVASIVGSFDAATVTERVTVAGRTAILSRRPTGTATATDGFGNAVTGFFVNQAAGLLEDLPYVVGPLTVTYAAGDSMVPASVTLATAIIAAHLWQTQRGNAPSALALQDPTADPTVFGGGVSYAIPNRAKELLEPYVRRAQVA